MGWLDLAVAVILAFAIIFIPGFVVGLAAGLRGMWLWGLAGPLGVSVLGCAAVIAPIVGLGWGLAPLALTALGAVIVVGGLRLLLWRRHGPVARFDDNGRRRWLLAAVVVATVALGAQLIVVIGSPDAISQTFDNIFHLNAIRYAADSSNASPFFVGTLTSAGGPAGFYPAAWHALGSLLVIVGGTSVAVASNAAMILFAAAVWPASILLLVREIGPARPAVWLVAGVLAATTPAFPMLMIEYGVLYPYMMGLSLVPAVLAAIVRLLLPPERSVQRTFGMIVVVLASIPGVFLAHPSSFVALLGFSAVAVIVWGGVQLRKAASPRRKILVSASLAAFAGVFVACWYFLRPDAAARTWEVHETVGQAVGEVVSVAVWSAPVSAVTAFLVIVGLVSAFRRPTPRNAVLLGSYIVAAGLYIVVSGLPYWDLRDAIAGPWYVNAPRLAALLPLVWVPAASMGAAVVYDALLRGGRRWASTRTSIFLVTVLVILVLLVPSAWASRHAVNSASALYLYSDDAPLLSADERALLDRLDDEVSADSVVIGSPWTGTALAYALADRRVLLPHTLTAMTEDTREILDGLDEAEPGSPVCAAVVAEGVYYVLDFGDHEVNGGRHPYTGFEDLGSSDVVSLVDAEGEAKLYRITGCS